jgi:putative hemin transport protein
MSFTIFMRELRQRHDALVSSEPKLRMRERARRLNASEAELVAAGCGVDSIELSGTPQQLVRSLGTLGRVMALSRNEWCVHERHGAYLDIRADGPVGLVLGPDIDLRMFFSCWRFCYAVRENSRHSLQFFDQEGVAVHKVYRTEETDAAAWDALVARFAKQEKTRPRLQPLAALDERIRAEDPAALRAHWLSLQDTHDFFPMLRKFKLSRLGALEAAGTDLAQPVPVDSVEFVLRSAAAQGLPLMCFVGNRGIVQIHTGRVHQLVRTGPWYNVLDETFNLHLNTGAITSCWIVNKPTTDGWVTSLEAFVGGELVVQFFGERKPGKPERPAWRELLSQLCHEPLAA